MQHVEAGFIGGKPGTFNLHATKAAHVDRTVWLTAPRATPLLQLGHFTWAAVNKVVDHVLLTQPVATGNGVLEVIVVAVVILSDCGGAPFGGYRVATHWIYFRYQRDFQLGIGFRGGYSCT
ncbi:hypothetical protein D3C77_645320 [compost metagenome]